MGSEDFLDFLGDVESPEKDGDLEIYTGGASLEDVELLEIAFSRADTNPSDKMRRVEGEMGEEEPAYQGCLDPVPDSAAAFLRHIPRDPRCITAIGDEFCDRILKRRYLDGMPADHRISESYLKELENNVYRLVDRANICYTSATLEQIAPPSRKTDQPSVDSDEEESSAFPGGGRALSFMEEDARIYEGDRSFMRLSAYKADGALVQEFDASKSPLSLHAPGAPSTVPLIVTYQKPTQSAPFGKMMRITTTEHDDDISQEANYDYFRLVPCQADAILQQMIDNASSKFMNDAWDAIPDFDVDPESPAKRAKSQTDVSLSGEYGSEVKTPPYESP